MSKTELELKMEQRLQQRKLAAEERDKKYQDLLESLKSDVDDDLGFLKTALTPIKRTKNFLAEEPKWNDLVTTYRKAKELNFKLLSVVLASVFYERKPAFLLSEGILLDLLEKNVFIKRKSINGSEYRQFMLFLFKYGHLEVKVQPENSRFARLVSLNGRLLEMYKINAYEDPANTIRFIVEEYIKLESFKSKKSSEDSHTTFQSNEEPQQTVATSNVNTEDIETVNKVMALEHKFGEYENKNFHAIAEHVRRSGKFKGGQKKLFVNFIKDKSWKGN